MRAVAKIQPKSLKPKKSSIQKPNTKNTLEAMIMSTRLPTNGTSSRRSSSAKNGDSYEDQSNKAVRFLRNMIL